MQRSDPFVSGEYYHLCNRGIDKREIFKLPRDYERFMMNLYTANTHESLRLDNLINNQHKSFTEILSLDRGDKKLISIGAWSLMTNHFHILVRQEVDGGITKFMKKLGIGYSMFFNIKYQRQGALFGGVFKSKLVEEDTYLRHLFGYIHLNALDIEFSRWENMTNRPIEQMKQFLNSYRYSSYLDYTGIKRVENNIISPDAFPDYFNKANSFENFIEDYLSIDNPSHF